MGNQLDRLNNISNEILIYGAHLVALECCRFLVASGKENRIVGFAVTNRKGNPEKLEGFPVREINEYRKQSKAITVVIAMPQKYHVVVETHAKKYGFNDFIKLSLEQMAEIKGEQLIERQKESLGAGFLLEANSQESGWLNIKKVSDAPERYYKFPTLFYRNMEDVFRETKRCDFLKDYQNLLGTYRNLHKFPGHNKSEVSKEIKDIMQIYMIFSGGDSSPVVLDEYEPWICPLHVGHRKRDLKISCMYDDLGRSISDRNSVFAEMTGAYWVWKNVSGADYKGLCHYRRHFIISEDEIRSLDKNNVDVILTTPRFIPYGVGDMFLAETPVKMPVFETMFRAVSECFPEDKKILMDYLKTCFYYPNNMVIARNDIYDSYCEWVFRILFRMSEIELETGYGHTDDRHIAYAAELLTSFYFIKNRNKYRITVTDYQFYQ